MLLWQRERGWDIVCELLVLWVPGVSYTTVCAAKQNIPWKRSFFLGCLRERLRLCLPGRTTAAFLIQWTTDNPREPSPLSPACRREQSGAIFRPRYGFAHPETPLSSPKSTSNKGNFNTSKAVSALSVSLSFHFLLPFVIYVWACCCLWEIRWFCGGRSLLQPAGCRRLVTLCRAHLTAMVPIYPSGLICGGPTQGDCLVTVHMDSPTCAVQEGVFYPLHRLSLSERKLISGAFIFSRVHY